MFSKGGSGAGLGLYQLLFGVRSILGEGYLSLLGVALYVAGRLFAWPAVERVGLWLTLPLLATLLISLLVLAPWFWLRDRRTR